MSTKYDKKQWKRGVRSSSITYYLLPITSRQGMTLVELLVAVSIMVLLVAVSVPMFKPMLDSQKTAGAAQTVAMALERAKVRAMETGKYCGVEFERFDEETEPMIALRMKLVKGARDFIATDNNFRVKVAGGTIEFYVFGASGWTVAGPMTSPDRTTVLAHWNEKVKSGAMIQLGRQGRFYKLDGNTRLASPFGAVNHPDEGAGPQPPVEFRVRQAARPMLIPPVLMPRGTVVDLEYSGEGVTAALGVSGPITVLFSPSGAVDRYFIDNNWPGNIPRYPLHFCIGEWERGISIRHEDGRNNIDTPSNFWVTVHPRTGVVRVSEMNTGPSDPTDPEPNPAVRQIKNARKFATENFVNIGGF